MKTQQLTCGFTAKRPGFGALLLLSALVVVAAGGAVAHAAAASPAAAAQASAASPAAKSVSTAASPSSTAGQVASRAEDVRPLAKGSAAPAFAVRRPDGSAYRFAAGARAKPAVLLFYRGGWCPFCNVQLGQLKTAEATLRQRGYEILFLSSDRPDILRSSLKDDIENETAHYTLLSDSDAAAARALGVAFRLDAATIAQYKTYGLDLEATQGNAQHILPVPAVFVVDRAGMITFAHFDPDYKVRLSPEALLSAAP
jgi:peroxiredoxin